MKKNDQQETLGHFPSEESAARAYDARARELHGEFARVNFPPAEESTAVPPIDIAALAVLKRMPEPSYPVVDPRVRTMVEAATLWRRS